MQEWTFLTSFSEKLSVYMKVRQFMSHQFTPSKREVLIDLISGVRWRSFLGKFKTTKSLPL